MKYTVEELKLCVGLPCVFNNSDQYQATDMIKVNATIEEIYSLGHNWYVRVSDIDQRGEYLGRVLEIPIYDLCNQKRLFRLIISK